MHTSLETHNLLFSSRIPNLMRGSIGGWRSPRSAPDAQRPAGSSRPWLPLTCAKRPGVVTLFLLFFCRFGNYFEQ